MNSHKSQKHNLTGYGTSCVMENPEFHTMVRQCDITSGGVEDHLPKGSPCDASRELDEVKNNEKR